MNQSFFTMGGGEGKYMVFGRNKGGEGGEGGKISFCQQINVMTDQF